MRHEKFGEGVIVDMRGDGDKAEATVRFRDAGEKTLLLAWAPLAEALIPAPVPGQGDEAGPPGGGSTFFSSTM